ncbi:hypothetical protein B0A52_03439 [Exophiala mesophila]|uniref:Uncharacterized protein n=1 Tax=Exophiala mesophila TaxID=212818 RepID=A0A438N5Y4_EXOME|nr:hypothetical protein B0A52_03439 [Exophiala mesophila]
MVEEGRVHGFLRGGSWRAFHWKRLIVGRKLYRIQYEDELREPPAEVDFQELVHFLLDWGAVPDSTGLEKLRSGGLWTPAGTVLLRKSDEHDETRKHVDWVLRTTMPDDSDGILSLTIKWSRDLTDVAQVRGVSSLAPGWGRLKQPKLLEAGQKVKPEQLDLASRVDELKNANKFSMDSTSFRFQTEDNLVLKVFWEKDHIESGLSSVPFETFESPTAAPWFTCCSSALLSQSHGDGVLWAYDVPTEIRTFVRKDSIPCGVMVILGWLSETEAPHWSSDKESSPRSYGISMAQRHAQRFQAQMAAERLEASMPPEQARIHRMNRQAAERQEQHNDMITSLAQKREKDERRTKDAVGSPRMSTKAVAEGCLAWLIEQGEVGRDSTLYQVAEAILYLMVVDQSMSEEGESRKIVKVLEEWQSWALVGGMKTQQLNMLEDYKLAFCFAAVLVAVVQEHVTTTGGVGRAGVDMLECLRLWRKVRLG